MPGIPPQTKWFGRSIIMANSAPKKAKLFNDFFSDQCKLILNTSTIPDFHFLTDARINTINFSDTDVLTLIRNLNPNKAAGSDGISGQMLLICDKSVVLPLEIIFKTILDISIYPDMWNPYRLGSCTV